MMANHVHIGALGEQAVVNHLKRNDYDVVGRNYRKKYGEIDIIARKGDTIHFVEVKAVSYGTRLSSVSRETWLPEENVEGRKMRRILRTIEVWLLEHDYTGMWQIDVASVRFDLKQRRGTIKLMENIVADF